MTPALTKREIAARFGVSTRTVQQWAADGCPCYRHRTTLRFDEQEVRAWLRPAKDAEPAVRTLRRAS